MNKKYVILLMLNLLKIFDANFFIFYARLDRLVVYQNLAQTSTVYL